MSSYDEEFTKLDDLVKEYQEVRRRNEGKSIEPVLFFCGMLIGQLATIYNLSPPGGVLNPRALFRQE